MATQALLIKFQYLLFDPLVNLSMHYLLINLGLWPKLTLV